MDNNFNNMVSQQLRTNGIHSESILEVIKNTPRTEFVPEKFKSSAYCDLRIPLPHGQEMLTPLEEALIIQEIAPKANEKILLVGSGSGYLTALLSHFTDNIINIELFDDLINLSKANLTKQNINNIKLIKGNGSLGYLVEAPYDAIIFTGGINKLDSKILPQLNNEGRVFAFIGNETTATATIYKRSNDSWTKTFLFDTMIKPLVKNGTKKFIF